MDYYDDYPPYITAAQRRAQAAKTLKKLKKEGYDLQPIEPFSGNRIAKSFWGHAWCRHLEAFSDYENRLPRGRSYLKNGSVAHLEITPGRVDAIVLGSERYEIRINISPLAASKWTALKRRCTGKIGSLIELLKGQLSEEVMRLVTDPQDGLFPSSREIRLDCDCPDYADLCKHLAAVLYGIGRRLDERPELLFTLRGVDQTELIETTLPQAPGSNRRRLDASSLGDVFGIEIAPTSKSDLVKDPEQRRTGEPTPPQPEQPTPQAAPKTKSPATNTAKKIATGNHVAQLRETFGMTEYEFAIIAQVSVTTVRNWEAKGPAKLRLRPANAATLATLSPLTSEAAWDRLNDLV